ncbi:uncharacterized protein [Porites lutea]|uniref:uncharacterized protein n=1 Tax=Porites lutea TaxID=51062 RepID=UPI003CC6A6DC
MNYFLAFVFVFSLGLLIVWAENIPQKEDRVGKGSASKPDNDHDHSLNYRFHSVENTKRETGAATWQKVNVAPVCFGAKDNQFGRFHVPPGRLAAIKLVHLYGYVSCYTPGNRWWSYWGCGENPRSGLKNQVNVVITTSANQDILPPSEFLGDKKVLKKLKWHKIPGFNSLSPELVLSVMSTPYWIADNHELRVWYGEDLMNSSEEDNGGTVCADVYALFV